MGTECYIYSMEYYSAKQKNKLVTPALWMNLKNIMLNKRNQNKIIWFHLYLVHKQAKLTYGDGNQNGSWLYSGVGLTRKNHKGNFRGDRNALDLGNGKPDVYICLNSLNCVLLNICVYFTTCKLFPNKGEGRSCTFLHYFFVPKGTGRLNIFMSVCTHQK